MGRGSVVLASRWGGIKLPESKNLDVVEPEVHNFVLMVLIPELALDLEFERIALLSRLYILGQ